MYEKRFIAYSLGNFCTYGRFNLRGPNALAPIAKININLKGEFVSGKIISAKQIGRGVTIIDTNNNAALLIKELTKVDFPKSQLKINKQGDIRQIVFE